MRNDSPTRVALYARVSTDEQAKSGYSIEDQRDTLAAHAEQQGWRVVGDIITDPGYSGGNPFRPGWARVMDLARSGEIDMVAATKMDRFFRDEFYFYAAQHQLREYGVQMLASNMTGNKIGDGAMIGWAAYERDQIAERTRDGKLKKARTGKVVGGHARPYGFDWKRNDDGKVVGYSVNPTEMSTAHRIFSEVAGGDGIRTIKERLDTERVPTPGKGRAWSRPFLRAMLLDDLYKPHTVAELREIGVSEEVASYLAADGVYGVYRYQEIPVPVPVAGIPRETVEKARHNIKNNRTPSRAAHRFWELSGGILRCDDCGRAMQTHSPHAAAGYLYYRCQCLAAGRADPCMMREMVRADRVEPQVWETVRHVMDDKHYVLDRMEEHFAQKRRELSRPGVDAGSLVKRLDLIEKKWRKNRDMFEGDVIPLAELKARRVELDAERETIERELEWTKNRDEELRKLDANEAKMRQRVEAGYDGLDNATPEKRREIYEDLGLRVKVGLEKRPRISGFFPVGKTEGDTNTTIVVTSPEPLEAGFLGKEATSSRRGGPSRRR